MKLLSIGTVAFDALETPFGKRDKIVGGSCTYIALSASYFLKKSGIVSVVGDDFSKEMIDRLKQRNIDLEGLQIKEGEKTFFWSGKYHNDMNTRDTLDTQLNVLENFDPVIPEAYQGAEYVMLGNLVPAIQNIVLDRLTTKPKLTVLDTMNLWMEVALDDLKEVISKIDLLTINDEEARLLSGEYSLRKAAKKIMTMGPKYLIIKKGEHGALLFGEDEIFYTPALPLEDVFDPTGAGDTFAGGFIGYLASTDDISFENMKRAVVVGSAMASFCVEKFGPERIEDLSLAEINSRVAEFKKLTDFNLDLSL
ncbi:PfkB family carbohydrate kinase [Flavobacteriales bacterium]|jgi:sugar/nucleoside kinase (ribokinase family)|nr:PfkB family carbohydrate kinase [Flavobacteriales bacterium]MDC0015076.1 PfkB family carbohydrate kinase [Flavobacteriales bacterium]MDG1175599.1 PfkB family carbohydrate kinase [Flavobacteriales bacterium]|tara:strand:+ start:1334 stop:2260 length:927 start_codon:yes stop_codon:yes gene_type:complete